MAGKSFQHVLRVRSLSSPAANILKQEMLSIGGDCATSRTVILGDENRQDVLLMANRRQLKMAATKLKAQPFGLKKVAGDLDKFLQAQQAPATAGILLRALAPEVTPPLLMGILNITTDSFSDGGDFNDAEQAISHGLALAGEGADIIDVGGESTRPGSEPVEAQLEQDRTAPVVAALAEKSGALISIDTMKVSVAAAALDAGAAMVNDVSAGRHDADLMGLVADRGCPIVLMHMQGLPKTMQDEPHYDNLMDELHRFFDERMAAAAEAGIKESQIILDPGIGFGKRRADNYEIVRRLRELRIFGRPLLVGTSRKSFLENELGREPKDRLEETITAGALAMANGADILRVHDITPAMKSRTIVQRVLDTA